MLGSRNNNSDARIRNAAKSGVGPVSLESRSSQAVADDEEGSAFESLDIALSRG